MALNISVTTSAETQAPSQYNRRYQDQHNQVAGAILIQSGTNRDVWKLIHGNDMNAFNVVELRDKVYSNCEEDIRKQLTEKYPLAPTGTYRVTERSQFTVNVRGRHGYKVRSRISGFAVMKKCPIAHPKDLDELRELSLRAGSLMVGQWNLQRVMEKAAEAGLWSRTKCWLSELRAFMNKNGFTANASGDFYQVRFNPKYFNSKTTMAEYRKSLSQYEHLMKGKPPEPLIVNLVNLIRPANWSEFPHLTPEQRSTINFVSDSMSERHMATWPTIDRCLRAIEVVFGKRCKSYRKHPDWKPMLKKVLPFMAGMQEKYGKYTTTEGRWKLYSEARKTFPWATAKETWRDLEMKQNRLESRLLEWLEDEIRIARLKIPAAPEPPLHPRKKRAKRNASKS